MKIRQATSADKASVFELLRAVSYADSYLFDYYDWMIRDPSRMYLSYLGDRLAGCYQVALLGNGEGVIGAGRIHPDFQGAGYARALFPSVLESASQMGAKVLRSLIFPDNIRSQKVATRYGFQKVAQWLVYYGSLNEAPASRLSVAASEDDLAKIQPSLSPDGLIASDFAVWLRGLRRSDLTPDRVIVAKEHGEIVGFVLREIIDDALLIQHVGGQTPAVADLLAYATNDALQRGCVRLQISVPDNSRNLFSSSFEFFRYDVFRM
jgi:ribosomal protein S18 acetylase RimI-like enzyme